MNKQKVDTYLNKHVVEFRLRVGHFGFGISEAELVYVALDEYRERLQVDLVNEHAEVAKDSSDDFSDAVETYQELQMVSHLQRALFQGVLGMAKDAAFPSNDENDDLLSARFAEQDNEYRKTFKVNASPEKEVDHD